MVLSLERREKKRMALSTSEDTKGTLPDIWNRLKYELMSVDMSGDERKAVEMGSLLRI